MVFKLALSSPLGLTCSVIETSWFVLILVRSLPLPSLTKRTGHSKILHRYICSYAASPLGPLTYSKTSLCLMVIWIPRSIVCCKESKDNVSMFQILVPIAED